MSSVTAAATVITSIVTPIASIVAPVVAVVPAAMVVDVPHVAGRQDDDGGELGLEAGAGPRSKLKSILW